MNQQADPADLSDTAETFLALLLASTIVLAPTATVAQTQTVCPLVGTMTVPFVIC
jgi:hypothetical protein